MVKDNMKSGVKYIMNAYLQIVNVGHTVDPPQGRTFFEHFFRPYRPSLINDENFSFIISLYIYFHIFPSKILLLKDERWTLLFSYNRKVYYHCTFSKKII